MRFAFGFYTKTTCSYHGSGDDVQRTLCKKTEHRKLNLRERNFDACSKCFAKHKFCCIDCIGRMSMKIPKKHACFILISAKQGIMLKWSIMTIEVF